MNEPVEPLDPRVAELLSASLDGALTPEERDAADAWIERSAAARLERDRLAEVKAAVGALPAVEPPAGFFEAMLERGSPRADAEVVPLRRPWGRSPATVAASAVATAAAWLLFAGPAPEAVRPPLDGVESAALTGARPFALVRQEGPVAWDDLPAGDRGERDGAATWIDLTTEEGLARVVVARDGAVYTLASEELDADALLDVGLDQPAGDPADADSGDGLLDRARRAAGSLVDALSGG